MKTENSIVKERKIKILHLEDVKSDADQIDRMLAKANIRYEKVLVDSRREFVNALGSFVPDLILSDHSMPTFNSLEAMEVLSSKGIKVPFILVTGAVSEEFASLAMRKGATDYVLKDRLQRLPAAIEMALENHQLQIQQERMLDQLKNFSRYSQDVICTTDREGRFTYLSDATVRLWGYQPEELIGKYFIDLVHPEDRPKTLEVARSIAAGNPTFHFENRYIRKDGRIIPIVWSSRWEDKEQALFAVARDATEQIEARLVVEESKRMYEQLVKQMPMAVYTCDPSGHILLYNDAAVSLWGRHPELGTDRWCGSVRIFRKDGSTISPDECPVVRALQECRPIQGEEFMVERPDGSRRHVLAHSNPQFDTQGKIASIINVLIDITDRKKMEEENHKLSLIASLTHNSVVVTDASGAITWVNRSFEKISEYSFAEVLSKKPGDLLQGPETDESTILHMRECRINGQRFRVEVLNYSKSGRKYWLDIECMPLQDDQGKVIGFIAIQQDITDRKLSDQNTRILVDKLKSMNHNLQQFSYIVSHNLRSPIARILGLSHLYQIDDENKPLLTERINAEAKNLDRVLKDMTSIVTIHNTIHLVEDLVDFNAELAKVCFEFEHEIETNQVAITSDFSAAKKVISVPAYIQSILFNLISNSIKYRNPRVKPWIKVKTVQEGDMIVLSVSDNGLGIDLSKYGDKLFGLYHRFHLEANEGRGVGLSLVKAHAEALGGTVTVQSTVNEGSTFMIRFKAKLPQAAS